MAYRFDEEAEHHAQLYFETHANEYEDKSTPEEYQNLKDVIIAIFIDGWKARENLNKPKKKIRRPYVQQ